MRLQSLFSSKKGIYMAHMYYGDPSESFSLQAMKTICDNGVDIIEFGIPFSDPNADGPVFQKACELAIQNGMTPKKAIDGIKKLRDMGIQQPIVVTSYFNPILKMGIESFIKSIKDAGADALIVPNVPFEESDELIESAKKYSIDIIFLIAPTTPEHRIIEIVKRAQGFLYVITDTGVTGIRDSILTSTLDLIRRIRRHTDIPLMCGFGISNKDQARTIVRAGANGVITGSVLGRIYEKHIDHPETCFSEMIQIVKDIKKGCNEGIDLQDKDVVSNE